MNEIQLKNLELIKKLADNIYVDSVNDYQNINLIKELVDMIIKLEEEK